MTSVADVFVKDRADNLSPAALYSQFIVPPFFQHHNPFRSGKSVRILGGRGCGKTMFVRYFGHGSVLNRERKQVPDDELDAVGVYLRPDTNFCGLMTEAWLGPSKAKLAFSHYIALNLLLDACGAVQSITNADFSEGKIEVGDPALSPGICALMGISDQPMSALPDLIDTRLIELEAWVRNPKQRPEPLFVAFHSVIPRFARDLKRLHPRLARLSFRSFIDEFENLLPTHREVICDAIKHPSADMVVHIAHKKEAVVDFKTSSDERVVEIHDITTIDLEEALSASGDFELIAAELLLQRLLEAERVIDCPLFRPDKLHDARDLHLRLKPEYREQVMRCVRDVLPGPNAPEIAREVVRDEPLRRRLRENLRKGLAFQKVEGVTADDLISDSHPAVSIVMGALLHRSSQSGKVLVAQFRRAISDEPSATDPFHKVGGWIDNNLYGCLFNLYQGLPRRPNILYSGFDRFCMLSKPNLRFFQALCHMAITLATTGSSKGKGGAAPRIAPEVQAQAARKVSEKLYQDILQLGSNGVQLVEIAGRLGRVFEAFNRRSAQSEPEINHFSIDHADQTHLSEAAARLLREAKIWSVLYEEKDTKSKSDYDIAQSDLILNPIYAPRFGISYRKRRKITLKDAHAEVILCQSRRQFEIVLKQLVDGDDDESIASPTLI